MKEKSAPTHNSKGTPCNIVMDCGATAHYVVGKKYACSGHKELAFSLLRKQRRGEPALPDVGSFEPEMEALEVEEVKVDRHTLQSMSAE